MCLHGAPLFDAAYGHEHDAISLIPRRRRRTLYFSDPRTHATTSPTVDDLIATWPLLKYSRPRSRTVSRNSRPTFWVIAIIPSHPGRLCPTTFGGPTPPPQRSRHDSAQRRNRPWPSAVNPRALPHSARRPLGDVSAASSTLSATREPLLVTLEPTHELTLPTRLADQSRFLRTRIGSNPWTNLTLDQPGRQSLSGSAQWIAPEPDRPSTPIHHAQPPTGRFDQNPS